MYKVLGANQQQYGPVTAQQVRQWFAEGRVNADTLLLAEGATEWKPLRSFPEFSAIPGSYPPIPQIIAPTLPQGTYGQQTNGLALTGMIMGILSMTIGWLCCFGMIFSVLGIIFSCVGLSQINRDPFRYTGKGFAIAGIILSVLGVAMHFIFAILFGLLGVFARLVDGIH